MVSFFTSLFNQKTPKNLSLLQIDMHSHLIPGIDDGAKTLEDSLALIRGLQQLGYKHLITTPHVYQELYPNTRETILNGLAEVQTAIEEEGLEITIEAAAEYFLDDHLEELLDQEELLTIGDHYVLVEMSFFAETPGLEDIFFKMHTKGYQPILAHPERYLYLGNDPSRCTRFREMGVLLQLNILSLTGHYGSQVKKLAKQLLRKQQIDLLGTDLHHSQHIAKLKKALQQREIQQVLQQHTFLNDTILHPISPEA